MRQIAIKRKETMTWAKETCTKSVQICMEEKPSGKGDQLSVPGTLILEIEW